MNVHLLNFCWSWRLVSPFGVRPLCSFYLFYIQSCLMFAAESKINVVPFGQYCLWFTLDNLQNLQYDASIGQSKWNYALLVSYFVFYLYTLCKVDDVVFAPNLDNSTWSLSYLKLLARRRSKIYKLNKCNDMFNIYFTRWELIA